LVLETLENWIHRFGALSPLESVGWVIRLSKHLESLHVHGVAHGCVSPACVLIQSSDPTSRGQVADVRRTAEALPFHSPERLQNGQLSPMDDAWGLASTLYKTLTTVAPFGETRMEIAERQRHVLTPLGHYGIHDQQLLAILAGALIADPRRRTANVATFRMQLEQWSQQPIFRALPPLEDEEGAEDDQGATAMLPMEGMLFDDSRGGTTNMAQPPQLSASPLGEQDATVMRELPAHIMALAARAAGGSNPPPPAPPDPPPPQLESYRPTVPSPDEDFGQATRVAPAHQLSSLLGPIVAGAPLPAAGAPPPRPSAPQRPSPMELHNAASAPQLEPPPAPRRPVPRAFKSTQLGMGADQVAAAAQALAQEGAPRPGFAPPPATLSTNPPPRDPDDVRTVMHAGGAELFAEAARAGVAPPRAQPPIPPPSRPVQPPPPDDDEDDGGRTVMRDNSLQSVANFPPAPPPPGQWAPAAPPVQSGPFQPMSQTERPSPMQGSPAAPPGPAGAGVSALINETLSAMGSNPSMGEATSGFPGSPMPGPFGPSPSGYGTPQGGLPAAGPFGPDAAPAQFPPIPRELLEPSAAPAPAPMYPAGADLQALPGGPHGSAAAVPSSGGSKLMLAVVCLLVLILAAAVTFLALKFRAQIGF
jgi:hypothetical protein